MKKVFKSAIIALGAALLVFSCSKADTGSSQESNNQFKDGKAITISATLPDVLTKVTFTPGTNGSGKPMMALTWESGDKLRVAKTGDHSTYTDFDLAASSVGNKVGEFTGTPVDAESYDVWVIHPDITATQTQASDGNASHLEYMAQKNGIAKAALSSSIILTDISSVLGIHAKLPAGVAKTITSVELTASENIFFSDKTLTINLTDASGAANDELKLYATLPSGSTAIPTGTTLFVRFNSSNASHTVYTAYRELGSGLTFESGCLNNLKLNCVNTDKYAGLDDDGTAEHKYLIADKYQMNSVNGLATGGQTTYFKLIDDINMSGVTFNHINTNSGYTQVVNFDGNNKIISNLGADLFYVFKGSIQNLTLSGSNVGTKRGIFAEYCQGIGHSITNVDIKNGSMTGTSNNTGALIGRINSGSSGVTTVTITDCDITDTQVKGTSQIGGLLGSVEAKAIVSNCTYSGSTVTGTSTKIGGLIGITNDNIGCTITGCRVEDATVDASGITGDARVGGFIGQLGEGSEVKGCSVGTSSKKVDVKTGQYDTENSKPINSGGFVGVNYGIITKDDASNRNKCYVHVTSTNTTGNPLNLGGFAGFQRGTISYSDAVVSMGDLQGQYIGGFCGYVVFQNGKTVLTDNCTVVGDGDSETVDIMGNNYSGGFVGVAESGAFTISNCQVLEGTVVVGQSTAGGFAGQIKSGTVEDCSATVDMRCRGGNDGGFVGAITGGTVQRCSSVGTLSRIENTNTTFGGFAGYLNGVDLTNCSSTVNITVAANYIGGLIGSLQTANTVSKCFYNGTISAPNSYKGGLIGVVEAVEAVITDCYTTGEIVASSGTQIYGGIVGELKAGGSVTNCYSTMDMTHGGRAMGGIVGRACAGGWNVSTATNNTVSKCIAWNPKITFDGTASTSASSGAIIGYTSFKNILNNCYRRYDMVYKNSNTAVGTTCQTSMVDQIDCDGTNWVINGTRPAGGTPAGTSADAQYQAPYYGVAASAGTTVSSLAQALGWSSDVWDFSADLPTLK